MNQKERKGRKRTIKEQYHLVIDRHPSNPACTAACQTSFAVWQACMDGLFRPGSDEITMAPLFNCEEQLYQRQTRDAQTATELYCLEALFEPFIWVMWHLRYSTGVSTRCHTVFSWLLGPLVSLSSFECIAGLILGRLRWTRWYQTERWRRNFISSEWNYLPYPSYVLISNHPSIFPFFDDFVDILLLPVNPISPRLAAKPLRTHQAKDYTQKDIADPHSDCGHFSLVTLLSSPSLDDFLDTGSPQRLELFEYILWRSAASEKEGKKRCILQRKWPTLTRVGRNLWLDGLGR